MYPPFNDSTSLGHVISSSCVLTRIISKGFVAITEKVAAKPPETAWLTFSLYFIFDMLGKPSANDNKLKMIGLKSS
jgi:hypothetical protein